MSDETERRVREALHRSVAGLTSIADGGDLDRRRARSDRRRVRATLGGVAAVVVLAAAVSAAALTSSPGSSRTEMASGRAGSADRAAGIEVVSGAKLPRVTRPSGTAAGSGSDAGQPAMGRASSASKIFSSPAKTVGSVAPGYYGYGYADQPYAPVFTRTTSDGALLRVYANAYTGTPFGSYVPFWNPPGWCYPDGGTYVGVQDNGAVGQLYGPRYAAVQAGHLAAVAQVAGIPEGRSRWVVLVQAPAGATSVRATFPGGGSDQSAVTDGLVVLTARGPAPEVNETAGKDPFTTQVEALDGTGQVLATALVGAWGGEGLAASARSTATDQVGGAEVLYANPGDASACQPPTTLPAPGPTQPADATASRAAITTAWNRVMVFNDTSSERFADVDDPAGLADVLAKAAKFVQGMNISQISYPFDGIVFADPNTAYFQYELHLVMGGSPTSMGSYFGEARRIAGTWKVTRGSVCTVTQLAGATC